MSSVKSSVVFTMRSKIILIIVVFYGISCEGAAWGPDKGEDQCETAIKETILEDRTTIVDETASRLHSTWLSQECEVRAGPEYVIRKYTFFDNGTFLLLRHHYAEESCSVAMYTVSARGVIRLLSSSTLAPGATEARYQLDRVHIVPLTRQVAQKFSHRVNVSCTPQPKWRPYMPQLVYEQPSSRFTNLLWEGPKYNAFQRHHPPSRKHRGLDCLEPLGIEFGELRLVRVQKRSSTSVAFALGSNGIPRIELLLGSLPPNVYSRKTHRSTSLQPTPLLRADTTRGCLVCGAISRGTESSPPVLHEVAALPALLGGFWLSSSCESCEGGMWIKRQLAMYAGDMLWTGRWDYYADAKCSTFLYAVTAAGSYIQRAGRQRRHGEADRDPEKFLDDPTMEEPSVEYNGQIRSRREFKSPRRILRTRRSVDDEEPEGASSERSDKIGKGLAEWMTPELARNLFEIYGSKKEITESMLPTVEEIREAIDASSSRVKTDFLPIDDSRAKEETDFLPIDDSRAKEETDFLPIDDSRLKEGTDFLPIDDSRLKEGTDFLPIDDSRLKVGTDFLPIDDSRSKEEADFSPIDSLGLNKGTDFLPIGSSSSKEGTDFSPIDDSSSKEEADFSPIDASGLKKGTDFSPIDDSSSKEGTDFSPIDDSSLKKGTDFLPIGSSSSKEGTDFLPIDSLSSKEGTDFSPIDDSSSKEGTDFSPIDSSSLKKGTDFSSIDSSSLKKGIDFSPIEASSSKEGTDFLPIDSLSSKKGTDFSPIDSSSSKEGADFLPTDSSSLKKGTDFSSIGSSSSKEGTDFSPIDSSSLNKGTDFSPIDSPSPKKETDFSPIDATISKFPTDFSIDAPQAPHQQPIFSTPNALEHTNNEPESTNSRQKIGRFFVSPIGESAKSRRSLDSEDSYRHLLQNAQPSIADAYAAMLRGNQRREETTKKPVVSPVPAGTTELDLHVAESLLVAGDLAIAARCGAQILGDEREIGNRGLRVRPLSTWPRNCVKHALEAPSTLGLRARVGVNWSGQYTLLLGPRDDNLWEAPLHQCGPTPSHNPSLRAHLRRSVGLRYGLYTSSAGSVIVRWFTLIIAHAVLVVFRR